MYTRDAIAALNDYSIPRFIMSFKYAQRDIRSYLNANRGASILENNSSINNIVIILGESLTRNHMSLYGYLNNTNPQLSVKRLFVFDNVISSFCGTNPSIENMFSFRNIDNNVPWNKSENLINVMKACGYRTYWISNQEKVDRWGSAAYVLSSESDSSVYVNELAAPGKERFGRFDEQVFPLLEGISGTNEKNFVVIHLMGNHEIFRERYPAEYEFFTSSDVKDGKNDAEKQMIAEYDNSVLYNDFVVNHILDFFADKDCLLIYLSDHGEELFQETGKVTHANTRDGLEIPFFVWCSDTFAEKHSDTFQQLQASNKSGRYMTDDFIHTVLDLAGIKTKDYDPCRSLVNKNFNAQRKRIVLKNYKDPIDFDEEYKTK